MANSGKNLNASQFFITFDSIPNLDNKHVVFGYIFKGIEFLKKIESIKTEKEVPEKIVRIYDCGEI